MVCCLIRLYRYFAFITHNHLEEHPNPADFAGVPWISNNPDHAMGSGNAAINTVFPIAAVLFNLGIFLDYLGKLPAPRIGMGKVNHNFSLELDCCWHCEFHNTRVTTFGEIGWDRSVFAKFS